MLAHSQPEQLRSHWQALNLSPGYRSIRAPEIGLVQLQARMGGTGERFFAGDATLTRAAIRLHSGTLRLQLYRRGATRRTPSGAR